MMGGVSTQNVGPFENKAHSVYPEIFTTLYLTVKTNILKDYMINCWSILDGTPRIISCMQQVMLETRSWLRIVG
jgi:hypothetical protein